MQRLRFSLLCLTWQFSKSRELLNAFTNEIIAHSVSPTAGGNKLYYMDLCPIIEAPNSYIKEELYLDFGSKETAPPLMKKYVYFLNNQHPAVALSHKSPVQHKIELGFP